MEIKQPYESLTEAEKVGIAKAVLLTFDAIDRSDLDDEKKRNLLFSVYSFRCLFDNKEMSYIHPVLKKYRCTFSCKLNAHPFYKENLSEFKKIEQEKTTVIPYGGLYVRDGDDYAVRFDAGSPVWQALKDCGKLAENEKTVPEKFDLYEMVLEIIRLNTADNVLKALWYLCFPYVMMLGAPHNAEIFEALHNLLVQSEIFLTVLDNPHSVYVRDSAAELMATDEIPSPVVEWYLPYISFKNEKDKNGVSREEKRFQRWLAAGRFAEVYTGTEKLLDTFPDDDGILLCNLAARVSLDSAVEEGARRALLIETLALINSALERGSEKKVFLLYYAGLAHLGLKNTDAALDNFRLCEDFNPDFKPAKIMLAALTRKDPNSNLS